MPRKLLPVSLPPEEVDREVRRATGIVPERISDEFAAVPTDIRRWGRVVAELDEDLDVAELALKAHEAERAKQIHDAAVIAKEKPPGEDRLKALVRAEPVWRELGMRIVRARRAKADAMAVLEAVREKGEMLVSLGAQMRHDDETGDRLERGIRDRSPRRA